MPASSTAKRAFHHAGEFARPTQAWVEKLARFGFAAKGAVYTMLGILAVQAAFGSRSTPEGPNDALRAIAEQPFGRTLLGITAFGLVAYSVWRVVQAVKDPDNAGDNAKGYAIRAGYVVIAILHAALAVTAATIAMTGTGGGGSSDQRNREWTAWLMEQPFGRWLVAIIGIIIACVGLAHFYRVYTARFMRDYNLGELPHDQQKTVKWIGRFGLAARGVVFILIGWFLTQAALRYDASQVQGMRGALNEVASQPYGQALMTLVAAGLVSYGIYCFIEARYRYFRVS